MTKADKETEERVLILIDRLERHLDRLLAIETLINNISDNEKLGEEIRKLVN